MIKIYNEGVIKMSQIKSLKSKYMKEIQEINDCLDDNTLGGQYEELTSIGYRNALEDVLKDLENDNNNKKNIR